MNALYTFHTLTEPVWDCKRLAHDGDVWTNILEARRQARELSRKPDVLLVVLTKHVADGGGLSGPTAQTVAVYRGGHSV